MNNTINELFNINFDFTLKSYIKDITKTLPLQSLYLLKNNKKNIIASASFSFLFLYQMQNFNINIKNIETEALKNQEMTSLIFDNINDNKIYNLVLLDKYKKINEEIKNLDELKEIKISSNDKKNTFYSLEDLKTPNKNNQKYYTDDYDKKTPSLDDIKNIVEPYGIDAEIIYHVMLKESHGNPYAKSNKGALGQFQFLKKTAQEFNLVNKKDMRTNGFASADTAARYLLWLHKVVNGNDKKFNDEKNLKFTLASYNAGLHNVKMGNIKEIPDFYETKKYVKDILSLYTGKGHYVNKNETLYDIAKKYSTSVANIRRNNLIKGNHELKYGDILYVGNNENKEVSLPVKKGYSWFSIAEKVGMDYKNLMAYNENKALKIGDVIKIPPLNKNKRNIKHNVKSAI
tara:strand:- start:8183 stop:9388 length:1206 start_codon:yes stop_codon:yes gene_type:complete